MNISALANVTKSVVLQHLVDSSAQNQSAEVDGDYDLDLSDYGYDESWAETASETGNDPISKLLSTLQKPEVMGGIEDMLKDSWKFIRLADDLHDIKGYLNDMRLCFIALTISGYVGLLIYLLILCIKRTRRSSRFR